MSVCWSNCPLPPHLRAAEVHFRLYLFIQASIKHGLHMPSRYLRTILSYCESLKIFTMNANSSTLRIAMYSSIMQSHGCHKTTSVISLASENVNLGVHIQIGYLLGLKCLEVPPVKACT